MGLWRAVTGPPKRSVGSAVGAAFWLSKLGTGRERSLYEVLKTFL